MAQMLVRKLDDDVMQRLRSRAQREGKSAEQLARETLTAAFKVDREQLLREMDELRARSKPVDEETRLRIEREARVDRERNFLLLDEPDDR